MVVLFAWLLILLSAFPWEGATLEEPDLTVQVGYYTYDVYKLVFFVNDPTDFPSPEEWEYLMTFKAFSIDATELAANSDTNFTCVYQCWLFSTAFYGRTIFLESEAAMNEHGSCTDKSSDPNFQPICFPDGMAGKDSYERLIFGEWWNPWFKATTEIAWIQPERHLPSADYSVGGYFSEPTPVVPSIAVDTGYLSPHNYWTITFAVWANVTETILDTVCYAGRGLSDSTGLCEYCPIDTYRPVYQRTTGDCWLCPQNSTGAGAGDTNYWQCTCDAGFRASYFAFDVSQSEREGRTTEKFCAACRAGQYGAEEACTDCPAGTYSSSSARAVCAAASAGYYQPFEGQTSSLPCEAGTYTAWTGAAVCDDCPAGSYADGIASSECSPAPAGYYTNGTGKSEPTPCGVGYYQPTSGTTSCVPCGAGTYGSIEGATSCTPTSPGHYQSASGTDFELPCKPGTYNPSTNGASQCNECPAGSYTSSSGSSACKQAAAGYFQSESGQTDSDPCSIGTYSTGGALNCTECPAGSYSVEEAASFCTSVLPGYYTNEVGMTEASACWPGSYSENVGATSCADCGQGKFSATAGATTCRRASPGHYQNFTGQTEQLPCPAGQYNDKFGAAACEECAVGYFSSSTGASSCEQVARGHYQSQAGQSESLACSPGLFSGTTGSSVCEECEMGTYASEKGSSRCTECSQGHFQNSTGKSFQYSCPPGSYNPSTGMYACFPCDPGQYASNYSQARCDNCPRGTYGDQSRENDLYSFETSTVTCYDCPSTSTTEEVGSLTIESCLCPSGSWGERTNCIECSEGMHCNELGLLEPKQEEGFLVTPRTSWRIRRVSAVSTATAVMYFDVFKCSSTDTCPGGPYGTCAANRDPSAVACGKCLEEYYTDSTGSCTACSKVQASLLFFVFIFLGVLCLVALAFVANRKMATQSKASSMLITSIGMAIGTFQMMSVFIQLSVTWMNPLRFFLEALSFLSFDLSILKAECILGSRAALMYGARESLAPVIAILLALILRCKKRWYSSEMRYREEYINTVGAMMQSLFVAVLVSVTIPFICYGHPNGDYSLVSNPSVLCFKDSGHTIMVTTGVLSFCVVILPFVVLVLYGIIKQPAAKRSSTAMMSHLRMFKFLFLQYEPHAYYFGAVVLARGMLICLVPVVIRDEGAAQVLAITVILLIFQILVRCIQPWAGTFSNALDGALSALMTLMLMCVAMSGTVEGSDELVGVAGLLCLIFCLIAMMMTISINVNRFLRPQPFWTYFVCHHKADAGGQARFLQLTFVQMTGKSCFIDSDHLVNLDTLFDVVRSKIGTLAVYLTSDTLRRPWCAGEVTVAFLTHKRAIPIYTDSFIAPRESIMSPEHILEYIASSDFALSDYGIGDEALSEAFQWIIQGTGLRTVKPRTNVSGRHRLVSIVEDCIEGRGLALKKSQAHSGHTKINPAFPVHSLTGNVVIAADHTDDEACAGAGIVMLKIYEKVVESGITGVKLLHELPDLGITDLEEVPQRAQSLIIVLSEGSLKLDIQLYLIMETMKAIDTGISVVPLTLPSFRFPTQSHFTEYLPERFGDDAQGLETSIKAFFKRIAVQFATHSSNQVLEAQAIVIFDRLNKKYVAGKQVRNGFTSLHSELPSPKTDRSSQSSLENSAEREPEEEGVAKVASESSLASV